MLMKQKQAWREGGLAGIVFTGKFCEATEDGGEEISRGRGRESRFELRSRRRRRAMIINNQGVIVGI